MNANQRDSPAHEAGGPYRTLVGRLGRIAEDRTHLILIMVVMVVMLAGVAYSIYLGNTLRFPDERDYYHLAVNIATDGRFTVDGENLTAFRPPGYPVLLALFVRCGANIVHLRVLNFLAMSFGIYLLHALLKTHSSACSASIGAVLVLCYPVLFYTAGTLYPQTIATSVFLLIVTLLMRTDKPLWAYILCGVLFGFLILTAPFFTFILGVCTAFFVLLDGKRSVTGMAITIGVAALPIGAWCVRNYMVFGAFSYISCNSGLNLLFGNSPETTPNTGAWLDMSEYNREAAALGMNEVVRDAFYRSKAVEYMLDNKLRTVTLYLKKLLNYFNYSNTLGAEKESSRLKDLVMLLTYGPLLAVFVVRLLLLRWYRPSNLDVLFIVVYFTSALIYAVFITRIRLRLPFDVLLIGVVAAFLGNLLRGRVCKS